MSEIEKMADDETEWRVQQTCMADWMALFIRGIWDPDLAGQIIAAQRDFALALEVIREACVNFQSALEAVRPADGRPLTVDDLLSDPDAGERLGNSFQSIRLLCREYDGVLSKVFRQVSDVIDDGSTTIQ